MQFSLSFLFFLLPHPAYISLLFLPHQDFFLLSSFPGFCFASYFEIKFLLKDSFCCASAFLAARMKAKRERAYDSIFPELVLSPSDELCFARLGISLCFSVDAFVVCIFHKVKDDESKRREIGNRY